MTSQDVIPSSEMQIDPLRIDIDLVRFLLVGREFFVGRELLTGREFFVGREFFCPSRIFWVAENSFLS